MSRPRVACTDCALPFYSDDNESCPYCGAPGPTGARAAPGRERVTCSDCGLPHYGDAEECPYCATASAADPEPAPVTEPAGREETPQPTQRRQDADGGNRTVVGRMLGAVRSLFGR